ncbi:MAG TPA: FAD-binding protein [Longimicrobiaceae bacterium]|nr:FAD-binding protein [Longimicrobiaceae bacterium]
MATAGIVDLERAGPWENYHRTGTSHLRRRWALRSGDAGRGRDDIAQAAASVRDWLLDAKSKDIPVRPVGGAWSLSNIQLVQHGWMLNTRRFNRCFRLAAEDFARPGSVDAGAFMLVEGGVQIDEINDKLQEMGRSLSTTGASNGQTLPGACATATHGSVLDAGGIQQHVRAVQIVTPGGIYWIEPAAGLMSEDFVRDTGSTLLRDDEAFAAALVAVGSLGIVTAMVIETEPLYLVRPYIKLIDFSRDDLETLQRGDFRAFSEAKGVRGLDPYFVMVITTPYRPFGRQAVVRFLYKFPWHPDYKRHEPAELGAGYDAQTMMAWALRNFPWARGWILQTIMRLAVGRGITDEVYGTWGESLETPKPLANSFSAALFCDRARLVQTLEALCGAFSRAGGSTAVTLRFVKGGHGLLSPARWENTAAIDCDGPGGPRTKRAYLRTLDAIERDGLAHTLHWGKINNLTPARVAADYGNDLVRWKAVRDRLLSDPADRRLFATEELRAFGLAE